MGGASRQQKGAGSEDASWGQLYFHVHLPCAEMALIVVDGEESNYRADYF